MVPDESILQVNVRGVELAVRRRGQGRPFLWAHGLTSSMVEDARRGLYDWTPLTATHEVIQFDARGHGESGSTADVGDYTWENLGRDILALADALDLDTFDLGGVSMGAGSSLWAVTFDPSRIRSLVLAGLPTAWQLRASRATKYEAAAHIAEKYGLAELTARMATMPAPAIYEGFPEMVHSELAVTQEAAPFVLRAAAIADLPLIEELSMIKQPTLLLAWSNDEVHPTSVAFTISEKLVNSQIEVASGAVQMLEWPDRVRRFLDNKE